MVSRVIQRIATERIPEMAHKSVNRKGSLCCLSCSEQIRFVRHFMGWISLSVHSGGWRRGACLVDCWSRGAAGDRNVWASAPILSWMEYISYTRLTVPWQEIWDVHVKTSIMHLLRVMREDLLGGRGRGVLVVMVEDTHASHAPNCHKQDRPPTLTLHFLLDSSFSRLSTCLDARWCVERLLGGGSDGHLEVTMYPVLVHMAGLSYLQ